MIKILLMAANPTDTTRLRLDAEVRDIDNALRLADFRDDFILEKELAVRVVDLQGLLLRHQPMIVHFSGHGNTKSEIILEDGNGSSQPVPVDAIGQLFKILGNNIRCVVLNACYSEKQAWAISQHVDCVIGMSTSIDDTSAINFSSAFYQALGYGKDIQTAFELGCLQINLEGLGGKNTPKLLNRDSVNPSNIILLEKKEKIPANLPFSSSYDEYLNAIRSLLDVTFHDPASLDQFCQEHFSVSLDKDIPLTWQFEVLIKYCQENQQLNSLLIEIQKHNEEQYKKHIHEIKKASKRRGTKASGAKKVRAEFSIPLPIEKFTPELRAAAVNALAHRLKIPAQQIKVVDVQPGSIKIVLEIPSDALDQVIKMYEDDRSALLRDLGISYVVEVLDGPYELENIKSLFVKGFTHQMLIDFCNLNYKSVLEIVGPEDKADTIGNHLIEQAVQKGEIPHLLEAAKKYNSSAYAKYHPYYRKIRKPGQQIASSSVVDEKMSRKELLKAVRGGFMLAVLGSMIMSFILSLIDGTRMNAAAAFAFTLAFNYGSYFLGQKVGDLIISSAKNRYDPNLPKAAIACYLIGFITGYSFPYFVLEVSGNIENKLVALIALICLFPFYVFILLSAYLTLFGVINLLFALFFGSLSVYRRVNNYPTIL